MQHPDCSLLIQDIRVRCTLGAKRLLLTLEINACYPSSGHGYPFSSREGCHGDGSHFTQTAVHSGHAGSAASSLLLETQGLCPHSVPACLLCVCLRPTHPWSQAMARRCAISKLDAEFSTRQCSFIKRVSSRAKWKGKEVRHCFVQRSVWCGVPAAASAALCLGGGSMPLSLCLCCPLSRASSPSIPAEAPGSPPISASSPAASCAEALPLLCPLSSAWPLPCTCQSHALLTHQRYLWKELLMGCCLIYKCQIPVKVLRRKWNHIPL